MLNLITLPYEVLSNIVGNINFDDVFSLGLTCKSFEFFITEESLAKYILLVSVTRRSCQSPQDTPRIRVM